MQSTDRKINLGKLRKTSANNLRFFAENTRGKVKDEDGKEVDEQSVVRLAVLNKKGNKATVIGRKQQGTIINAEPTWAGLGVRIKSDSDTVRKLTQINAMTFRSNTGVGIDDSSDSFPAMTQHLKTKRTLDLEKMLYENSAFHDSEDQGKSEKAYQAGLGDTRIGKKEIIKLAGLVREKNIDDLWNSEYRKQKIRETLERQAVKQNKGEENGINQ